MSSFGAGFNQQPTQPASTGFSFGSPQPTTSSDVTYPTSTGFGNPQPTTSGSAEAFSFGNPQPTTTSTNTGFGFGTTTTTHQPQGNTQPTGFSFGSVTTNTNQQTGGGFTQPTQPASTGFSFGSPQPTTTSTNTGFGFGTATTTHQPQENTQPTGFSFGSTPVATNTNQQTGFAFGTPTTSNNNGFAFGGAGFSFGVVHTDTSLGYIRVPFARYFGSSNLDQKEFCDLNIEIHDENGFFSTLTTHRLLVATGEGLLSNLVKNSCIKKNEKFTLEISTSLMPESKYGKIKAQAIQHAISSLFESTYIHIEDALQVLLVTDHFQIDSSQLVSCLNSAFCNSEYVSRVFVKNFNTFYSNYPLPQSPTTSAYFRLFREAFSVLVRGRDLENQIIIKDLSRALLENELRKDVNSDDLPKMLNIIDIWISSHLNLSSETASYQISSVVDNIQIKQPQTLFMMIGILSTSPSPYQFVNSIAPEWKLKLINKYVLLTVPLCNQQPQNLFPVQQQQQPLGFF